ncbi:hypothetical protein Tsubulata_030570 [Turnera subulata]|uniref:Uncharacterized protein n=1 Tax=Turnera subulata TaxID=218843 RepID=A0A9Q0G0E9_9ROSI|nr:hypothetical protein Tsubulata_030570 [Turnera subulata]
MLEFGIWGNVYIVFPMKRTSPVVVAAADMAVFFMAANYAAKRISGGKSKIRVLPESGGVRNEYKYRGSVFRSKKPMSETIKE